MSDIIEEFLAEFLAQDDAYETGFATLTDKEGHPYVAHLDSGTKEGKSKKDEGKKEPESKKTEEKKTEEKSEKKGAEENNFKNRIKKIIETKFYHPIDFDSEWVEYDKEKTKDVLSKLKYDDPKVNEALDLVEKQIKEGSSSLKDTISSLDFFTKNRKRFFKKEKVFEKYFTEEKDALNKFAEKHPDFPYIKRLKSLTERLGEALKPEIRITRQKSEWLDKGFHSDVNQMWWNISLWDQREKLNLPESEYSPHKKSVYEILAQDGLDLFINNVNEEKMQSLKKTIGLAQDSALTSYFEDIEIY